jgi:hypothetical protein
VGGSRHHRLPAERGPGRQYGRQITKAEAAAKVQAKLERGCAPINMWVEL